MSPPSISLVLSVSRRCNLRCRFCYERAGRPASDPGLDEVEALLGQYDPASVRNVMFMAGET